MSQHGFLLLPGAPEDSRVIPITDDLVLIGRSSECHVRVSHPLVSRKHCEVWAENGGIFVRDLASNNGTYVNNQRLEKRRRLGFGDLIQVGPLVLQLVQSHQPHTHLFGVDDEVDTGSDRVPVIPANSTQTLGFSQDDLSIIKLLAEGKSEKQVAAALQLNRHSVHDHVKRIYKRLGISSRAELITWYWGGANRSRP